MVYFPPITIRMASKTKPTKLETDIDKFRNEANWAKSLDACRQLSNKDHQFDSYLVFIQAEFNVERFMMVNTQTDETIEEAKEALQTSKIKLTECLSDSSLKSDVVEDCHLLIAKICYCMGQYHEALANLKQIGLEQMTRDSNNLRKLQLIGEGYAIKGLCLEKLLANEDALVEVDEDQVVRCYEMSGDLSLLYLQQRQERTTKGSLALQGTPRGSEHRRASVQSNVHAKPLDGRTNSTIKMGAQWNLVDTPDMSGVNPLVEEAFQRSPILSIHKGQLMEGIDRFRELLQAVETSAIQNVRQTLSRQLVEVLLRGVSKSTYSKISSGKSADSGQLKPKKYCADKLYCPQDRHEEMLLLLLISESIASREALLNRSPEHSEARIRTFQNAAVVYDLLTITLARNSQYTLLSEMFERAMKFSFSEFHIWHQYAQSLTCAEKYKSALLVLKECLRLQPNNSLVQLQAAKLCYDHLNMVGEGLAHSQAAIEGECPPNLLPRCYIYVCVGHGLLMYRSRLMQKRKQHQQQATIALQKAMQLDSQDYLAYFHRARQLAIQRDINEAFLYVRRALQLRHDHIPSLHLLVLLLSSKKKAEDALSLLEVTLTEYPDNFHLLMTRSSLEEQLYGTHRALSTCKYMLQLWKKLCEPRLASEIRGTGLLNKIVMNSGNLAAYHFSDIEDKNSATHPESIAASKIEHRLSEVASSLGSTGISVKQGPKQLWSQQATIWILIAEIFLRADKIGAASACVAEAAIVNPLSHHILYLQGRLAEYRHQWNEAKLIFENAMAINPLHVDTLQHLGFILTHMGKHRLAEKILRNAINADPTSSIAWYQLGEVLGNLEEHELAADCFTTALDLEATDPIVPFSVIPMTLH